MEKHDSILLPIVNKYDGLHIKSIGDSILAVFYQPSDAVECAIAIQDAIYNAPLIRPFLKVRIGMDMGQVAREQTGGILKDIFGRFVNRAARIEGLANGGHILCSESVQDNATGWVDSSRIKWHDHGSHYVKGVKKALKVWEPYNANTIEHDNLSKEKGTKNTVKTAKKNKVSEISEKTSVIIKEPIINSLGMKFAFIPPGTFMMGSPEYEQGHKIDEKLHKVTLTRSFYMQTTPVTQGQWKALMNKNPSSFKENGDNNPVECVSWKDVQEYIKKLNQRENKKYRLPTEAEWEYACRAGNTTRYNIGDSNNELLKAGWYIDNSNKSTHPVGEKKPNAWGLYDMHGNVWEWCQDRCDYKFLKFIIKTDTYVDGIKDPLCNKGSARVTRGGSWRDNALSCRSAKRNFWQPGYHDYFLGFRLVF